MDNEGCRLEAYRCPSGIWTIGWGHVSDAKEHQVITQHQADVILEFDLHHFELGVENLAPKANGNQFSALVSFAFNLGVGALQGSTLLKFFLAGAPLSAAEQFSRWVHDGKGDVLPGLVRRRAQERALFLSAES
jgi:lysozyme